MRIILIVLLLFTSPLYARQYFFEFAQSLSYTGINAHLLGGTTIGDFEVYVGPKFIVSDQYLVTDQVISVNAGTRYIVLSGEKWKSYFNFDFNITWMEAYESGASSSDTYNTLTEYYFGYGLSYKINPTFTVGNIMGYGKYVETFHNLAQDSTEEFSGMTGIVKFFIRYDF
jgi:hypothetical protein